MIRKQGGSTANDLGKLAEQNLVHYLDGLGYLYISECSHARKWVKGDRDIADWCLKYSTQDSIYMRAQPVVRNIYGQPWHCDFFIWQKTDWPRGLFIEIKSQSVPGSVDEKLPFIELSLKALHRPSVLLMMGQGFKQTAIEWVTRQQTENFLVFREPSKVRDYINTGKYHFNSIKQKIIKDSQSKLPL